MPIPSVIVTPFSGPAGNISASMDGMLLALGGTPDPLATGGYAMSFVPDGDWIGGVTVMGEGATKRESDDTVPPVPYPFRAFYLNGNPSDLSMQVPSGDPSAYPLITGRSEIIVPSSGQQIYLLVSCSQGSCDFYLRQVMGSTAP